MAQSGSHDCRVNEAMRRDKGFNDGVTAAM